MDDIKKKLRKDDVLKITRILGADIYLEKSVKILLIVILFMHAIVSVIQIYFHIYWLGMMQLIRYGPVLFGILYAMVAIVVLLCRDTFAYDEHMPNYVRWPLDHCGESVFRQIKRQSQFITLYTIINLAIALFSAVVHIFPDDDDSEIFFAIYLFEKFVHPKFLAHFLVWMYRLSYIPLAFVMTAHCYQGCYLTQHIKYQIQMIFIDTKNTDADFHDCDEERLYDRADFHEKVKMRLNAAIGRHAELINLGTIKLAEIRIFIFIFSICGCLLGISILFFVYTFQGMLHDKILRLGSVILAATSTSVALVIAGQDVENVTEEAYRAILSDSKWYTWSVPNKKSLLILLQFSMRPFKVKFTENISVNYSLGVAMVKWIYSALSICAMFQNVQL